MDGGLQRAQGPAVLLPLAAGRACMATQPIATRAIGSFHGVPPFSEPLVRTVFVVPYPIEPSAAIKNV
jgi:hypothetical protein